MTAIIPKPRKVVVPLARGLAWRGGAGFLYLRKYDGQWDPGGLEFNGHRLIVERMRADVPGGAPWFAAHSLASIAGQNVLNEPTRLRWRELCRMARDFPAHIRLAESGNGGEFLQAVLDNGGEGVCAFDLEAPWGEMWAAKRLETFQCVVTGFCGGTQSVAIRLESGQPCGHVALRGGKIDRVRVGSVLKLEGFGLTRAGLIREPRLCRDTLESWLISF